MFIKDKKIDKLQNMNYIEQNIRRGETQRGSSAFFVQNFLKWG